MKNYIKKLAYFLPVYLLTTVVLAVVVVGLRYLCSIWFQLIDIKEYLWVYAVPIVAGMILMSLWINPRIKRLYFGKKNDDRRFMFQVLWGLGIIGPVMYLQYALPLATSELHEVSSAKEIPVSSVDNYYALKEFGISTDRARPYVDVRRTGRHGEYIDISVYYAVPFTHSEFGEKVEKGRWYGVKFHKSISNSKSDRQIDIEYREFMGECQGSIANYDWQNVSYFKRVPASDDRDGFEKAIEESIWGIDASEVAIFEPVNESFGGRSGVSLYSALWFYLAGIVLFLLLLTWPALIRRRTKKASKRGGDSWILESSLAIFVVPNKYLPITSTLVFLNALMFIVMVIKGVNPLYPTAPELLEWGGNRRPEVISGEWWRLMSSMFMHAGIMHILFNMFGLIMSGPILEAFMGRLRFALLYIGSGLVASLSSLWWHENTVSVGASGAIMGVFAAGLTLVWLKQIDSGLSKLFGLFLGLSIGVGFFIGADNAAHIGGALAGMIITLLLYVLRLLMIRKEGLQSP